MKDLGIYIHIPFCISKCYYCDFTSFSCNKEVIDDYIDNLIKELSLYKDKLMDYSIKTIFIGGGTPSSIDAAYIGRILDYIYENFNIDSLIEVSIEANPGTLDRNKVKTYRRAGINRVSLGLQSLNDKILNSIGRIHTARDFYSSLELLREEGFSNINVDLMFSLPGQTMNDLEDTLSEIINKQLEHISLYSLIIEDNTLLGKLYNRGLIEMIDEELDRQIYHRAIGMLKDAGYNHYEISNFSKPNHECLHNLVYWKVEPYLGVGISSHSNIFSKRFFNFADFKSYNICIRNNNLPIAGEEVIDKDTLIGEYMIMGLRLIEGINICEYKRRFSEDIHMRYGDVIRKHLKSGLIKASNSHIALTKRGLDLANIVELDFYDL